jgi:hypothetical protein
MRRNGIQRLVEILVKQSFPSLKNLKIELELNSSEDYLATATLFSSKKARIRVCRHDIRNMNSDSTVGCIAHELCHLEDSLAKNFFFRAIDDLLYTHNQKWQTMVERRIDTKVIEKGFGKELLALLTYHDQHFKSYNAGDGLTKTEILELIRSRRAV